MARGGGGREEKNVVGAKDVRRRNPQNEPLNWTQGRDTRASDLGVACTVVTDPRLGALEEVRAWSGGRRALAGACWQTPTGRWV